MASFLDELCLIPVPVGYEFNWRLAREFDYWTDVLKPRYTFRVPANFVTDLASIPRVFWNILPPFGRYTGAAVIHDFLYQFPFYKDVNGDQVMLSRAQCDSVLKEAMGVLGVSKFVQWVIYTGVRAGGWMAWNEHRKQDGGLYGRTDNSVPPSANRITNTALLDQQRS